MVPLIPGLFIVVEGPDGAGKTTQARLLAGRLQRKVLLTNEPTRGPIGTCLRDMLTGKLPLQSPECLALLFAADRLWHLESLVLPALARGIWVVSDRYELSNLIYQSKTEADVVRVRCLNQYARRPHLTLVLNVPDEELDRRLLERPGALSRFDDDRDLQRSVRARYRDALRLLDPDPVVFVDGSGDMDAVHSRVWSATSEYFGEEGRTLARGPEGEVR